MPPYWHSCATALALLCQAFGTVVPIGWHKREDVYKRQPLYYNFKTSGRRYEYVDMEYYPLYRFGFGLSYTSFEYSNLKIQEKANGNVEVQATVKNVGSRAGDEVAQLYVTDMYASVKTRVMELKDFARIHLQPGESKTVSFEMTPYDISLLNDLSLIHISLLIRFCGIY